MPVLSIEKSYFRVKQTNNLNPLLNDSLSENECTAETLTSRAFKKLYKSLLLHQKYYCL